MCTLQSSAGVVVDHSQNVNEVAYSIAHEMGHNLGMIHDEPYCKCDEDRCIMARTSLSVVPLHWSSCSIDQLNLAFHSGLNYCLR